MCLPEQYVMDLNTVNTILTIHDPTDGDLWEVRSAPGRLESVDSLDNTKDDLSEDPGVEVYNGGHSRMGSRSAAEPQRGLLRILLSAIVLLLGVGPLPLAHQPSPDPPRPCHLAPAGRFTQAPKAV